MRHLIFMLTLSLLTISCGQTGSEQKEQESKEKVTRSGGNDSARHTTQGEPTETKPGPDLSSPSIILTPLSISGDIGYVTFSKNAKTIFYYDAKSKKGKIILNGREYVLTKTEGAYRLSGDEVTITTSKGNWEEMVSDCAYGEALVVTIKLGGQVLQLDHVDVQDCQGMVE